MKVRGDEVSWERKASGSKRAKPKGHGGWGGRLKGTEDMALKGRDEGDSAEEKPRFK